MTTGPLSVGIGGPVGAGKTTLTEQLCRALAHRCSMAVVTNDIYTREDAEALARFEEPKGRGQIRKLSVKGGQLRLVDDAYNASPISVKGAIEKLADMRDAASPRVRTVVVLGDMLELGEAAEELHVGLVPTLVNNQMDLVFAAGKFMESLYLALPEAMRGAYKPTSRELAPMVAGALQANDLVLVKGSRGSRMDLVVEAIEGIH